MNLWYDFEYEAAEWKIQIHWGWGLGIKAVYFLFISFPTIWCIFIQILHNVMLHPVAVIVGWGCWAWWGRKGSSGLGKKWAQTSASKWFLSLGQTPPHPHPTPINVYGWLPEEGAVHKGRQSKHLHCLILPQHPHRNSLISQVTKDILFQPLNLGSMMSFLLKKHCYVPSVMTQLYPVSVLGSEVLQSHIAS